MLPEPVTFGNVVVVIATMVLGLVGGLASYLVPNSYRPWIVGVTATLILVVALLFLSRLWEATARLS